MVLYLKGGVYMFPDINSMINDLKVRWHIVQAYQNMDLIFNSFKDAMKFLANNAVLDTDYEVSSSKGDVIIVKFSSLGVLQDE